MVFYFCTFWLSPKRFHNEKLFKIGSCTYPYYGSRYFMLLWKDGAKATDNSSSCRQVSTAAVSFRGKSPLSLGQKNLVQVGGR
jgi:hypothetical protein